MNNKKALVSLGLTFLLLCSGCASESANLEGIDIVYTQTEQAAQTIHTEDTAAQIDNAAVTGNITTDFAKETESGGTATAATVSAVESATVPMTTASTAKHTTSAANKPKATAAAAATAAATAAVTTTTTTPKEALAPLKYSDDMTTVQVVKNMGLGINLGNTFEPSVKWDENDNWIEKYLNANNYETAWGSPIITKQIIEGYAKCGFGALRIPVAWSNFMSEDYTINNDLMNRIKQVTQWTVNSGMYAIVNIHWDGGWWEKFPDDKANCMKKYTRVWEQICEGFKDFDGRVVFESLNEEGGSWESLWNRYTNEGDKEASYKLLNEINQKFVDIVRGSSYDNNKNRHLLIAGFCTDIDQTCDKLYKMPNDPKNRCAISVHYYTPATFALIDKDEPWGKVRATWGTEEDMRELVNNMQKMKERFVDKGVPVIIGEYSVCAKKLRERDSVHLYITSVIREATKWGMCPVLWDVPHGEENIANGYYDRTVCQFLDRELLQKMKDAYVK